ncbi:hypothetical protein RND81_03G233700 [Saponaria officinalis]|uniref:Uncharacterized protein n=1 Tax=Saponaria officinalis TaxID=3572 RepID=A0AAW1M9P8_SAPOF
MEKSEPSFVPEWLRSKTGGGSSHHFASSQADRKSSSNSPRSSSSNNSSNRRDKNPYSRSHNNSSRNQCSKDREYLGDGDTWDFEYSDPLTSFSGRRPAKGSLERSKSMISGKGVEPLHRRAVADLRNRNHYINSNGNEAFSVGSGSTGTQMSFEKDFPFSRSEERSTTPDIIRVPSPGLSRGVQGLSIRSPPLVGSEGRTSALAKGPVGGSGSNIVSSPDGLQRSSDATNDVSALASALTASAVCSNGFISKTEASVQAPVRSLSVPKVLNPSDKLKPKTAARSNDGVTGPKNGLHQIASAQLGSQAGPSLTSAPIKNANMKHVAPERKTSASNLNAIPVADKRLSLAQLRSRHNFLNLMREKSVARSSSDVDPVPVVSSAVQNIDESKGVACDSVGPSEKCDGKCNGDASNMAKSSSDQETAMSQNKIIHTAEELEFLHALGWEDDDGDDEGLTEEEITAFVNKYMTSKQAAKLLKGLQSKMTSETDSQGPCTDNASSELAASGTQL